MKIVYSEGSDKKIIYTESAKEELKRFHYDREEELKSLIRGEKYVFGDELVEITGSDIREAEKRFYIREERSPRIPITGLLFKIYFVLGIAMAVYGIFYDEISEAFTGNPIKVYLAVGGIMLSIASLAGSYYLRYRQNLSEEYERIYRSIQDISETEHSNHR